MTKEENDAIRFLSKYKSCTQEQLIFFTGCSVQDINRLIKSNLVVKDVKSQLLYLKLKKVDVRTAVALDVLMAINGQIRTCNYSKRFPVIFTVLTNDNKTVDIAVVRNIEQPMVFRRIDDYSKADKLIIVIEKNDYDKEQLNTKKEVLLCSYPIKIIDKIN